MSSLNTNHPLPDELISISQGILLENSKYWTQTLGKDHQIVDGHSSAGFEGQHLQVNLFPQGVTTQTPQNGADSVVFGSNGQLYWRSTDAGQTDGVILTPNFPWGKANAFPLFGKNVNNYNGVGVEFTGGWTFLPGGLIMQYGLYNPGSIPFGIPSIPFPISFNIGVYYATVQQISKAGGTSSKELASVVKTSTTNLDWNFTSTPNNSYTGIYWMAIGT